MSSKFHWGLEGLDHQKFRAYTSLLQLRCGSQEDPDWASKFNLNDEKAEAIDNQDDDDVNTVNGQQISDFDETKLKQAFLDRLAELTSSIRKGGHIAATLLLQTDEATTVFVAKNNGFNGTDLSFLESIQACLRDISHTESFEYTDSKSELWRRMLEYYEPRLQEWTSNLRRDLKKYEQAATGDDLEVAPGLCHLKQLLDNLIHDTADQSGQIVEEWRGSLVDRCYNIRRGFQKEDLARLCSHKLSLDLWLSIGFMSRLRTAYKVMVRAAQRLSGFEELKICPVKAPKSPMGIKSSSSNCWSLQKVFGAIGEDFSDGNIKRLFKQSRPSLMGKYNKELGRPLQYHAEVQLILHIAASDYSTKPVFKYIGCSKYSCLLCYMFVTNYGQFDTQGCHGKVTSPWSLPQTEGLSQNDLQKIIKTLESMQKQLERRICDRDRKQLQHGKESTVGGSSIETKLPLVNNKKNAHLSKLVSDYLQYQRSAHVDAFLERIFDDNTTDSGESHDASSSQVEAPQALPAPAEIGYDLECNVCGKITNRRCSICQKDWFCSEWCQQRMSSLHKFECSSGSLTTADYLERAVYSNEIPDDPQTVEDYGFSRCTTWNQKSHLLGLYGGLIKVLEVGPSELDQWRRDGKLLKNIIEKFRQVPEGSRGAYFPWIMKNTDLLDESASEGERGNLDSDRHEFIQWLECSRSYLPQRDKAKNIWDLEPIAKRDSYIAYAISLHGSYPHPAWISTDLDIWYELGFCVAGDEGDEMGIGGIYNKLIGGNKSFVDYSRSLGTQYDGPPPTPTCSFEEFWHAYESGRLIELMDQYGLKQRRLEYKHLDTFLSKPPGSSRPSVWRLQHMLALDNTFQFPVQVAKAAHHYGLTPRTGAKERTILTAIYRRILSVGDPLDLHNARCRGDVWTYAQKTVLKIDPSVASILQSLPRD